MVSWSTPRPEATTLLRSGSPPSRNRRIANHPSGNGSCELLVQPRQRQRDSARASGGNTSGGFLCFSICVIFLVFAGSRPERILIVVACTTRGGRALMEICVLADDAVRQ